MREENKQGKSTTEQNKSKQTSNFNDDLSSYWLSALVDSADDAIISKTLDGIITSWNRGAERIFGYTAEEAIGKSILMLIPPAHQNEEPAIIEKIKAGERVAHFETIRQTKDGRLVDLSLTISPIFDADRKILGASKIARVITDLKETKRQLQASEERYRSLFNSIDEGFCVIEMMFDKTGHPFDYRFLETNPPFEEETGLIDAKGKTMLELVPNHDDSWFEIYGKVALEGEPIRFENYAEVLDRWFDLYAFRVGAPEEHKVAVIFKNITERKKSEESARRLDARLRLALNIARTSTFEIELATNAVQTDAIGREIYGFEPDEPLTFEKVKSHFHPDDRDYVMRNIEASLDPHGTHEFEVEQRIIRADGETRWIRVMGRTFFEGEDEAKRAVMCLGTYIDITRQKQAEKERLRLVKQLLTERARLKYLFTKAPAFVATLQGPEHIFELTNPAYQQVIGHRAVVGKTVREALPEIEGQGFYELLDDVYQTGEPFTGREIPIQLQLEPNTETEQRFLDFVYQPIFDDEEQVSGIFVHGIDITEQVQARRQAENANRAKDEFLATLSHELRTPLNAILGWSKMMTDGNLNEASQKRALEVIQRNALIQTQLIDDILDVSRIISGKLKLEVRPVELTAIVEAATESVLPAAEAKGIRLQRVLDSGSSMISGDPNRLQQIIWNLVYNAVKFTPKEGRVQVRLERVNSHIEIIVTDTGIGISPQVLPYIFDRFRQADSTTTRNQGGLGLGLAIVKHLVEMHGGTVEAESAGENQGATFTVKLPLIAIRSVDIEPESEERVHPTSSSNVPFKCSPELEGLHILVVDDEKDGRKLVATVLEQCGAKVTEASSVTDALKAFKEHRPDILLSDLGMPGEDGYSLIEKVRALPPEEGGRIPAAALTAYARVEDRMHVLRAGFQIHLPKPIEPAELVTVVSSLSGRDGHQIQSDQKQKIKVYQK